MLDQMKDTPRAERIAHEYNLTPQEIRTLVGAAHVILRTFDPTYQSHWSVSRIATHMGITRPTLYAWTDIALGGMVQALRSIKVGRPTRS